MLQAESLLCHVFCESLRSFTQKASQPLRGRSSQLKPMLEGRYRAIIANEEIKYAT